jgi:hypothetical protein
MNKEIVSFNAGEMTPKTDALSNVEKYASGCRHLENFLPRIYGSVERRPGTIIYGNGVPGSGMELRYSLYFYPHALTYISDNTYIWGVPLNPLKMTTLCLDAGGAARNVGGGVTALPCFGHPFKAGQAIRIANSTNYNAQYTLLPGTSFTELLITKSYVAETFGGDETVVRVFSGLAASAGRMARDEDNNLYYGHNYTGGKAIYTIFADGTTDDDFFYSGSWPAQSSAITGLKVSSDNLYLYVLMNCGATYQSILYKFNLSDGSAVWGTATGVTAIYDIDIDSDDNVYALGAGTSDQLAKFAAADGAKTSFTSGTKPSYAIRVDNALGVVIVGGSQVGASSAGLYNISVCSLDSLLTTTGIALGGTYYDTGYYWTYVISTGCIVTYEDYIYVLNGDGIIYKLDVALNIIAQVTAPTYFAGIFIDPIGHIVIIEQGYSVGQTDIFWFYDTNLNYLGKIDGYYSLMFQTWNATFGGVYIQGNTYFPNTKSITG